MYETLYDEPDEYLFKTWTGCDDDGDIHLYVTYDGGHSWPGGERAFPGADPPSEQICANDLMWTFFRQHPLGGTSITEESGGVPYGYKLLQNHPNLSNKETTIGFELKSPARVDLSNNDIRGRRVRTLASSTLDPGRHSISWNGEDIRKVPVPRGVYT